MKKRVLFITSAIIASSSLTGCVNYGTDFTTEYKDYLDYAFGGDYTITVNSKEVLDEWMDAYGMTNYDVTFTGYSGEKHTERLVSYQFTRDARKRGETRQGNDALELAYFVSERIRDKIGEEFFTNIVSNYVDGTYIFSSDTYTIPDPCGENVSIFFYSGMPHFIHSGDENTYIRLATPGTGFCYADAELKNFSASTDNMVRVSMTLPEGADTEKYIGIFEAIEADFTEYTGTPQNYFFSLRQYFTGEDSKRHSQTIREDNFIHGEAYEGNDEVSEILRRSEYASYYSD